MHPVLIQEQNFAHLPAETKHVTFNSQGNSCPVVMQNKF